MKTNQSWLKLRVQLSRILAVLLLVSVIQVPLNSANAAADSVYVSLGETPVQEGITPRAGDNPSGLQTGTVTGSTYWETGKDAGTSYIYLDVDNAYLYDSNDYDVDVTIAYYDEGNGKFVLQYDAQSAAFKDIPLFQYGNSMTWQTHTFSLKDARFADRTNGADIRISVEGGGIDAAANVDLKVAAVTVKKIMKADSAEQEPKVYSTIYPTQDIVIADGCVKDFGAAGDGIADDTQAFQNALNAAGNRGGGVVFAPEGRYKLSGNLTIPTGVTLRGDWVNPDTVNKEVKGTILEAYGGKGDPTAPSFIQLSPSSGVTNLSVWYPEQSASAPFEYPWTFEQLSGDSATIKNVTLVNSYNGIKIGPVWNELHYVRDVYGTVLNTGIFLDYTTDIGRLERISLSPDYWVGSGLESAPQRESLTVYLTSHAEGIVMGRSDWEYMSDIYLSGFKTGMRVTTRTGSLETANAQLYKIKIEHCQVALKIEGVNDYGLLVSDSSFKAEVGEEPVAIYATQGFGSIVQFNQVTVGGNPHNAVVNEGAGVMSFENSSFESWNDQLGGYAIVAKGGSLILGQSTFAKPQGHVLLQGAVAEVNAINSGYQGDLQVKDESDGAQLNIHQDSRYMLDSLPVVSSLDIAQQPKPAAETLYNVAAQPYGADTNGQIDASSILEQALNDALLAGGGTVYLPAGIYRVDSPITVPSGVELRGSWDVPHHTIGGGTVLFTNYGENDPHGTPLISLEANAGVRGLSVYYDQQNWNTVKPYSWTIQGKGHGVYAINTTLINSYQGIDFGSYDTSGHYIDYVAGSPLKEGIFLGGGAEGGMMRNVQFNPHYYGRNNYPNHPATDEDFNKVWSYQKENLDAFRIGDVKGETIFNTFVYGSMYGIHFEDQDGRGPEATVIGHGTDGSKKGVVVDSAGPAGLALVNTELVSLSSSDKVYVVVGEGFDSKVTFFNTSMWGDTTRSFDVHAGTVRIQQSNFTNVGERGINALGGDIALYDSYFQQPRTTHVYAGPDIAKLVITNNLFKGGLQLVNEAVNKVSGTNLVPVALGLKRSPYQAGEPENTNTVLTLTNVTEEQPLSGQLELLQPAGYASQLQPVRFRDIALGDHVDISLPFLSSDTLKYRVTLENGYTYTTSVRLAQSFAIQTDIQPLVVPRIEMSGVDQYSSVGGQWKGTDDLSAQASLTWDAQNLYAAITVQDDTHAQSWTNGDIWQGDSLQLGIDLSKKDGSASRNVNELGFALDNQGHISKWRWRAPEGVQAGTLNNVQAEITRDESNHQTIYRLTLPFNELHGPNYTFSPTDAIGLTLLINENDGAGRSGYMEYNQGIGSSKDATLYGDLFLLDSDYTVLLEKSAAVAVREAELQPDLTQRDAAANFVILLPEGTMKTELTARLAAIGSPDDPDPLPDPNPEPGTDLPPSGNPTPAPATSGSGAVISLRTDGTVEITSVPLLDAASQTAKSTLTVAELTRAFEQSKSDKDGIRKVSVHVTAASGAAGYGIELPTVFVASDVADKAIEIKLPTGTLSMPGNLLTLQRQELGSAVTFNLHAADRTKWSKELLDRIGSRPAVELSMLTGDHVIAWNNTDSPLTLALPYSPSAVELNRASNLGIWHIVQNAQASAVPDAKYRAESADIVFKVPEAGQYVVIQAELIFNDLGGVPWAKEAIEQLAAKGIIQGVSEAAFNPGAAIKRADFVKLLVDTLELSAPTAKIFSDVEAGSYYAEAVGTAQTLGIAAGAGNGRFLPETAISREEAAVFIDRALRVQNDTLSGDSEAALGNFKDVALIADYARSSMNTLAEAGVLKGNNGALNPKSKLTRAEAAVLLYRIYSR